MTAEKVIQLDAFRPHLSGTIRCFGCRHEWVAVAPTGTTEFECPACGAEKGRMKFECLRDEMHWTCNCGNSLFSIVPNGTYCPNCGSWQNP